MEPFRSVVAQKRISPMRAWCVRGFTLVEMLVVLGIIAVITAIVVTGESGFNGQFFLTNTTYDVALSIRQAQTYGVSSQSYSSIQNPGYGISISQDSPSSYVFFSDFYGSGNTGPFGLTVKPKSYPGNHIYDSSQGELVQQYSLNNGYTITQFCMEPTTGGIGNCYQVTQGMASPQVLNIVFSRPNDDVTISTNVGGGSYATGSSACFVINDSNGNSRYIRVSKVGQVSVTTGCSTNQI